MAKANASFKVLEYIFLKWLEVNNPEYVGLVGFGKRRKQLERMRGMPRFITEFLKVGLRPVIH